MVGHSDNTALLAVQTTHIHDSGMRVTFASSFRGTHDAVHSQWPHTEQTRLQQELGLLQRLNTHWTSLRSNKETVLEHHL